MTDPTELRRLAEAATPGVWIVPRDGIIVNDDGYFVLYARCRDIPKEPPIPTRHEAEVAIRPEDAAYIAAMHPATTLALLDRLARAEAIIQELRGKLEVRMQPDAYQYYREPVRLQPIDREDV